MLLGIACVVVEALNVLWMLGAFVFLGPNVTIPNDPYGRIKPDKRTEENIPDARESVISHAESDVDSGQFAQHHTIGTKRDQAASGQHSHTGKDSVLIGKGAGLTVTGSRGGNAALDSALQMLAQVIDFDNNTTA